MNNPIRFNDPTGHEPGDCYDRGYCQLSDLTPGMQINKAKSNHLEIFTDGAARTNLINNIEKYMSTHPKYDPNDDYFFNTKFGGVDNKMVFDSVRNDYWKKRARDENLCGIGCEFVANDLSSYYDYHNHSRLEWASAKSGYILLDIIGIPLGMVGYGIPVASGTPYFWIGVASGGISFTGSTYNDDLTPKNDRVGQALSVLGVIPIVGSFSSAFSLGRDLGGAEMREYIPPIPRIDQGR